VVQLNFANAGLARLILDIVAAAIIAAVVIAITKSLVLVCSVFCISLFISYTYHSIYTDSFYFGRKSTSSLGGSLGIAAAISLTHSLIHRYH
jgi:fucose permease